MITRRVYFEFATSVGIEERQRIFE